MSDNDLEALRARNVSKEVVDIAHDGIDEFIVGGAGDERPWESFELTQREDVTEWIADPLKIAKIQPNLADVALVANSLPPHAKLLDVGCYGGYFLDYLRRNVYPDPGSFEYVGVDVQARAVAAARAAHAGAPDATFVQGDIFSLAEQFDARQFDMVFCSRVLIHLPYFERALENLAAISSRAVFLVLTVAERSYVQRMLRRNLDTGEELHYFFRYFSVDEIARAAAALQLDYRITLGPGPYASVLLIK